MAYSSGGAPAASVLGQRQGEKVSVAARREQLEEDIWREEEQDLARRITMLENLVRVTNHRPPLDVKRSSDLGDVQERMWIRGVHGEIKDLVCGEYSVTPETYQGHPVWKKLGEDVCVLRLSDGMWYVTDVKSKESGELKGWMHSSTTGVDNVTEAGPWVVWTGRQWQMQDDVVFEEILAGGYRDGDEVLATRELFSSAGASVQQGTKGAVLGPGTPPSDMIEVRFEGCAEVFNVHPGDISGGIAFKTVYSGPYGVKGRPPHESVYAVRGQEEAMMTMRQHQKDQTVEFEKKHQFLKFVAGF